jgi:hypothetical protein
MTTLRQPLVQLGHAAVTTLFEQVQHSNGENGAAASGVGSPGVSRTLWAELIVRRSTGPAPVGAAK